MDDRQREYTLPEYIARGAMGGAAASLILLPAVSFLARRMEPRPASLSARLQTVARQLSGTECAAPVYENRPAFVEHVLVGAVWGALYGLIRGLTGAPTVPTSQAYGLALTPLDDRILPPLLRVFPSNGSEFALPMQFRAAAHFFYGTVLGLAFDLTRTVLPGRSAAEVANGETPPFGTSRYAPSNVVGASSTASSVAYAPAPPRSPSSENASFPRPVPTAGETIPPREASSIGSGPLAGTMPTAPEAPERMSVTGRELLGKMVSDRDGHAIGEVCKIELNYVEVSTPIVDLGPTLYVPYNAFSYCLPQGCYLDVTLQELAASGWNTVPPDVLGEDANAGPTSPTSGPRTSGQSIEIPYFADENARHRFQ